MMAGTAGAYVQPSRAPSRAWKMRPAIEALFALTVVALLLGAFGVYLLSERILVIKEVSFEGNEYLSDQQILEAANVTDTDTFFSLDTRAIRARVLKMPYIKSCEVRRMGLSAVLISVTERAPVVSVMVNNHVYELDQDFRVLREVHPLAPPTGPLVTNLPGLNAVVPGQHVSHPVLSRAVELWRAFSAAPVAQQLTLSEISGRGANELIMVFNELPYETRWGRDDFPAQVRRFEALLREKQGKLPCEEYLDMRYDADIVCK